MHDILMTLKCMLKHFGKKQCVFVRMFESLNKIGALTHCVSRSKSNDAIYKQCESIRKVNARMN